MQNLYTNRRGEGPPLLKSVLGSWTVVYRGLGGPRTRLGQDLSALGAIAPSFVDRSDLD
jgi:hypothetical protein